MQMSIFSPMLMLHDFLKMLHNSHIIDMKPLAIIYHCRKFDLCLCPLLFLTLLMTVKSDPGSGFDGTLNARIFIVFWNVSRQMITSAPYTSSIPSPFSGTGK